MLRPNSKHSPRHLSEFSLERLETSNCLLLQNRNTSQENEWTLTILKINHFPHDHHKHSTLVLLGKMFLVAY